MGATDDAIAGVISKLSIILDRKRAYKFYPEALVYSTQYMIAGQSDLVIQRTMQKKRALFDFYDYKTNLEKGIQFTSMGRKDGLIKHYNRFLLHPVDHLEDCNYNLYSLQLSIYAYLAQTSWNIRVGRLAIIYINRNMQARLYPVPYMRHEAKAICDNWLEKKPLPAT